VYLCTVAEDLYNHVGRCVALVDQRLELLTGDIVEAPGLTPEERAEADEYEREMTSPNVGQVFETKEDIQNLLTTVWRTRGRRL
jgi:hypothetical protein